MLSWLVIGVGNEFRGDDAVGCLVAREMQGKVPDYVRVIEHQSDGTALLRLFAESENIIIIDAVTSGKRAGTIHRLDLLTEQIPANFIYNSSHLFGIPEAVALGRELGQLPARLILYGVEAVTFDRGTELSPTVRAAAKDVQKKIIEEIDILNEESSQRR